MSEPEFQPARPEAPAPTLGIRLAWWFAIYLAGAVSVPIHERDSRYIIIMLLYFSLGLMGPAGLVIYAFHFWAMVRARTRRSFLFLLLLLVAIVFLTQHWISMLLGAYTN